MRLETLSNGKYPAFSWRKLITGRTPEPSELRRFVNIQPVLDFDDLQPGRKATAAIREAASRLGLTPERGVKVRLTGSVALSDEEFATIADGAALNGVITLLLVVLVLWLALKKARIILAVFINLVGRAHLHRRYRALDGRSPEPDLRRLRRALCRARRRFRHPVQRALPRRTICIARSRRTPCSATARGIGGAAFARGSIDRRRLLLVPADGICRPVRTRTDRRNGHDRRVRERP